MQAGGDDGAMSEPITGNIHKVSLASGRGPTELRQKWLDTVMSPDDRVEQGVQG